MAFMKFLAILALASAATATNFHEYRQVFKKDYANVNEMTKRHMIFESNLKKIDEHNAKFAKGEVSYSMGVNQFTDMTEEELSSINHGLPLLDVPEVESIQMADILPPKTDKADEHFSWRDLDYVVTSVKNQGGCGSCSAFAATASIESCYNIKHGKKIVDDLSEQFLVDCGNGHYYQDETGNWGASGCSGAWPQSYFHLIYKDYTGYDEREDAYPYEAADRQCRYTADGVYDDELLESQQYFWHSQLNTEDKLMEMIKLGPVATTIQVINDFYGYNGGIYNSNNCCTHCSNKNNHAVTVVGYGTQNGVDYWEVKNSWGAGWGEKGFFKIARGMGLCGFGYQMVDRAVC